MLGIIFLLGGAYAGMTLFAIALGKAAQRGDRMMEEASASFIHQCPAPGLVKDHQVEAIVPAVVAV